MDTGVFAKDESPLLFSSAPFNDALRRSGLLSLHEGLVVKSLLL